MSVDDDDRDESILTLFDQICFSYGDQDAIVLLCDNDNDVHNNNNNNKNSDDTAAAAAAAAANVNNSCTEDPVCYIEIQECSFSLAYQIQYRYRPDYVLVDCFNHVTAEAVATIACMRIQLPFVPVSVTDQHAHPGRLKSVVTALRDSHQDTKQQSKRRQQQQQPAMIVAICCCEDDEDPVLGVFYQAGIHTIIYIDKKGNMREQISVPTRFQNTTSDELCKNTTTTTTTITTTDDDDLYVLFTSGTSGNNSKAVVGSHQSTFRRLEWFRSTFDASPRVARRTKLTFVDGITELFGTLLHPPSMLLAVKPERFRVEGVSAFLSAKPAQITVLPSQLAQLLLLPINKLMSLERIIVSGEPFSEALWNKARTTLPKCQFLNLYGQTESTGDVSYADLMSYGRLRSKDSSSSTHVDRSVVNGVVAVGKPILDRIQISSNEKQEIIVTGNLANKYLGQPCFESFTTGDIGFCKDGIWYVQGRCDDVVKFNGVWTSPSEVETAFVKLYNIAHNDVAAVTHNGNIYLISEQSIPSFSREHMREAGLPWNLIPKRLFWPHKLPVAQTGAGKVDRAKLKTLVQGLLRGSVPINSDNSSRDLRGLISQVLGLSCADETKSFAELGGDSASAVTLLYKLRSASLAGANDLNAADILMSDSIAELNDISIGKRKPKRQKREDRSAHQTTFLAKPSLRCSDCHVAVEFKACVDSGPVLSHDGASFYIGCQGGVFQQINAENGSVITSRHFCGWMIQADCILSKEAVVVCLYKRHVAKGLVLSLSFDLKQVIWKQELDGRVLSTPVKIGCGNLCVSLGDKLLLLNIETGAQKCCIDLPDLVRASPAMDVTSDVALYAASNSLLRVEWSSGDACLKMHHLSSESTETIGPVYKDLLTTSDSLAIIASSWGSIHSFPIGGATSEGMNTHRVSNYPLSPPARLDKDSIVVGSYDGFAYCLSSASGIAWKVNAGGCVYAKPLVLPDRSCVVCTTAGDIVLLNGYDGKVIWRYRIDAEIWSSPVLLDDNSKRIAFGARDSKVHIITIGSTFS